MANPILGRDLYQDDGTINNLIKSLTELATVYNSTQQSIVNDSRKVADGIKGVNENTAEGREELEELARQADQLRGAQVKLTASQTDNAKAIEQLRNQIRLQQNLNKLQVRLDTQEAGSKQALNTQLKINTTQLEQLTAEGKEFSTEADAIRANTDRLTQELMQLGDAQRENTARTRLQIAVDQAASGSIEEVQAQLKRNRFELGLLTESGNEYSQEAEAIRAANEGLTNQLAQLRQEQATQNQLNKLNAQLATAAEGSYDALSAQYSINRIALNRLSQEERENTEEGRALTDETAAIREEMKRLQAETGNTALNVGNYENSIVAAFNRQSELRKQLQQLQDEFNALPQSIQENSQAQAELSMRTQQLTDEIAELGEITGDSSGLVEEGAGFFETFGDTLDQVPGAAGDAIGGVKGLGASFKALLANPVVLVIAGIVAALSALVGAFSRSEKGARLFEQGGALVEGLLSTLTDIAVSLVDIIVAVFEDPLGSLQDFGQALLDNIINRFTAIFDLAGAVGDIIGNLLTGNFDAAKEAAVDAGQAIIQLGTGLDPDQQRAFAESVAEVAEEVTNNANAFIELNNAQEAARTRNRELTQQLQQQVATEERLQALSSDQTQSLQELNRLNAELNAAQVARAQTELALAQNNLGVLNREIELRRRNGEDVRDLLDQQVQALGEVAAAESALTTVQLENTAERNQLRQDEVERNLDILIDNFDNQKSVNERLLQDDRLTADQKQQILTSTQQRFEESFAAQVAQVQSLTDTQIDANALVAESDSRVVAEQIQNLGVSDQIAGRLLEIIRERRTAIQDLNEAERDLQEERLDRGLDDLEIQQELAESEFNIRRQTAFRQREFALNQERERLEETLRLNREFNATFTDEEEQTLLNRIAALNRAIDENAADKPLLERLGLELTEDQQAAIAEGFNNLKSIITDFAQARVDAANMAVEAADREVSNAQSNLDAQIALQQQGFAADVAGAQQELQLARDTQDQALADQQRALRAQQALQTIEQAANLVTASAKIFAQVGNPLIAIPLIGLMFGAFITAKVRAAAVATETFGDGGLEILQGGSHASGNDIHVGYNRGRELRAEGGEAMAIINKSKTAKYAGILPDIVDSLNGGYFEDIFLGDTYNPNEPVDLQDIPHNIRKMASSKTERWTNGRGQLVERYQNVKTTYI